MSSLNSNSPSAPPGDISARTRVLVIDDDKKLCRLIADYLTPMGYDVASVHTGPEGVARATGETWHAVLLDVMLPGLDGFEVLKRIRRDSNVPVLMLTARGEEADRCAHLGVAQETGRRFEVAAIHPRRSFGGGIGLGLAIVRSCVEACRGTVVCRNLHPKGFEVELSLECCSDEGESTPNRIGWET